MKKEQILGYIVERKKVKNINVRVKEDLSVYVTAPINLHSYYIENFLRSKQHKIEEIKRKLENHKSKIKPKLYITGEIFRFLGMDVFLEIRNSPSDSVKYDKESRKIIMYTNSIDIDIKKKILDKWYYENAKKVFNEKINKWLHILEESIEHLSIKTMKTRWGSCNYNKRYINLNTELIKRSDFEIEYVVLHELTHLKYPNHGSGFYKYIEKYMPNYKKAEELLKIVYY